MSGHKNAKRHLKKRPPLSAQEGDSQEGSGRRAGWSADLRDKIAILVAAAVLIPIVVFGLLSLFRSDQPDQQLAAPTMAGSTDGPKTAAIVDQLSLTQPNRAFVETATQFLEEAGYAVDYYPGEEVTVDFYRELPTHSYGLLILRNHSSVVKTGMQGTDDTGLYTSEPYDEGKYLDEQMAWHLVRARYHEGGPEYFGIAPEFVRSSMRGRFDGTTVILMGCDGLRSSTLADAFIERGAESVVGWSGRVSAAHTDAATYRLLQHLVVGEHTTREAVIRTWAEVGPDPHYDSTLAMHSSKG